MNWNQIEGYWTQLRGKMRESWGQMTHRHLDVINGQREQLLGLLQRRYGANERQRDGRLPSAKAPKARVQRLETQSEVS